jgi:Fic family protein|tara:strand:- start:385 stop:741 length:357 start_codon:yes stop_codon:yes gene_type:complete
MNIPNILISSITGQTTWIHFVLAGAIVGGSVGYVVARLRCTTPKQAHYPETESGKKKKENLKKIENYIAKHHKIANDDVERVLGVGNTSAWRYLNELEEKGKIKQVGKTGKHTYYEKI